MSKRDVTSARVAHLQAHPDELRKFVEMAQQNADDYLTLNRRYVTLTEALEDLSAYAYSPRDQKAASEALKAAAGVKGLSEDQQLIVQAYQFGQFADDFDRPLAKPLRLAIRRICAGWEAADGVLASSGEGVPPEVPKENQ